MIARVLGTDFELGCCLQNPQTDGRTFQFLSDVVQSLATDPVEIALVDQTDVHLLDEGQIAEFVRGLCRLKPFSILFTGVRMNQSPEKSPRGIQQMRFRVVQLLCPVRDPPRSRDRFKFSRRPTASHSYLTSEEHHVIAVDLKFIEIQIGYREYTTVHLVVLGSSLGNFGRQSVVLCNNTDVDCCGED